MKRNSPVCMRPPDSADSCLYLLEELAKPLATVTGSRISVWIYYDGPRIREIILSGHTESVICLFATSALIDAVKALDRMAEYLLTCGAAYIRIQPEALSFPAALHVNKTLEEMLQKLRHLAAATGQIELIRQDWHLLAAFRHRFNQRARSHRPQVVMPNPASPGALADFLPVMPERNANGTACIFHLEGWDFDCPEFQMVADRHLRNLQRELLRDALRRRQIYRGWLKDWTTWWVDRIPALPNSQAHDLALTVPVQQEYDSGQEKTMVVSVHDFLNKDAGEFLDRGQDWHKVLARNYTRARFGQLPASELDKPITHQTIVEIDFERGISRDRKATDEDRPVTLRERLLFRHPQLIASCLLYIHRMNAIIKPYEELWLRRPERQGFPSPAGSKHAQEAEVVSKISKSIVMETMIRGWPSIYMEDEKDREVFRAWEEKYRARIWAVMAKQAKAQGVRIELLLEDNIVYDVRFNSDLGCTIQPLMLVDDASHVQVHETAIGASVVIPLWPRRKVTFVPEEILRLGDGNCKRAASLVKLAQIRADESGSDSRKQVAALLRSALCCHPAEAGKLILLEWARRLGRDTSREFNAAKHLVEAAEWALRYRYAEAKREAQAYLEAEPDPVGDAHVIIALADLAPGNSERELRELHPRVKKMVQLHDELRPGAIESYEKLRTSQMWSLSLEERRKLREEVDRFTTLSEQVDQLLAKVEKLKTEIEAEDRTRTQLVQKALRNSASVQAQFPALAAAATHAADELQAIQKTRCLYAEWSDAMIRRYADIRKTIEVRGLLDTKDSLSLIYARLEKDPNVVRKEALEKMQALALSLWLPAEVEADLKSLAEEFGKGDWDRMQSNQIQAVLFSCVSTCRSRIQDLLSDRAIYGTPLAEPWLTRIYITQTIERSYKEVLGMLLSARVSLGRAFSAPWTVRDTQTVALPQDGKLQLDIRNGTIVLRTGNGARPLLSCPSLSQDEAEHLAGIIEDPAFLSQINHFAPSLVQGLLTMEIEPCRNWQIWRDAMKAVSDELLFAMVYYGDEATLLDRSADWLTQVGREAMIQMDRAVPRETPETNRENLSPWERWIAQGTVRTHDELDYRAASAAPKFQ